MHRRLIALTLAASLALAACSGDDDGETADAGEAGITTTTAAVPDPENGETTTTAAVAGDGDVTDPGDEPGPVRPQPAAVGRYRYELQQDGRAPTETFLVVQPGEETDGGVYQGHTFAFDGRRRIVRFGSDGEVVESVEVVGDRRYAGASYVCDWDPDAVAVPGGALDAGRTWASETSCEFALDGQQVRHEVTERREVVGRRTVSVAGQDIEVVEIRRVTNLVATGGSDFTQETTATDLYAPILGLTVRTDGTVTIATGDEEASGRVVLRLLDPEPTSG